MADIGVSIGITRERVRQIEKKALRKLRHPSRLKSLRAVLGVNSAIEDESDSVACNLSDQ